MTKKIRYEDEPMDLEVVPDFLPPPEALVRKQSEGMKVTLVLDRHTVEFFKREADRQGASYQRMIRRLLEIYAAQHE